MNREIEVAQHSSIKIKLHSKLQKDNDKITGLRLPVPLKKMKSIRITSTPLTKTDAVP
jgi:hypothetical protein